MFAHRSFPCRSLRLNCSRGPHTLTQGDTREIVEVECVEICLIQYKHTNMHTHKHICIVQCAVYDVAADVPLNMCLCVTNEPKAKCSGVLSSGAHVIWKMGAQPEIERLHSFWPMSVALSRCRSPAISILYEIYILLVAVGIRCVCGICDLRNYLFGSSIAIVRNSKLPIFNWQHYFYYTTLTPMSTLYGPHWHKSISIPFKSSMNVMQGYEWNVPWVRERFMWTVRCQLPAECYLKCIVL